ncbi:MAG: ABC transporter permease [Acidobacteria bacterium]|nr:ABC transporter permease [Acidobacteriota bacterium]
MENGSAEITARGTYGERASPREWVEQLLPFASVVALFIALSIFSPYFLTVQNLSSVARQTAVINIIALGMTLIMISGGIDLSVGSVMAFAGICGTMLLQGGVPLLPSLLGAIMAGAAWGLLNSALITLLRVSPFIATLGTMGAARGLTLVITNGMPVVSLPDSFGRLGDGNLFGVVPIPLAILVLLALVTGFILKYTRLGRYAYAVGSNVEAARYAGVPIRRYLLAVYIFSGSLTGLAGMIESSRLMTGQPTAGQGYELSVIAAVVIGGGSLSGGEGTVTGTIAGAFLMGLISNGSNLLGVSPFWQQVLIGSVIVLAVAVDELRKRHRAAS